MRPGQRAEVAAMSAGDVAKATFENDNPQFVKAAGLFYWLHAPEPAAREV